MNVVNRIAPALLLGCSLLAAAQTAPKPASPVSPLPSQTEKPIPQSSPAQAAEPEFTDPCLAHASDLNLDTCYADLAKIESDELNHIYRAALLVFEHDIDNAHKRGDNNAMVYDSTAIFDLKAAQAAWTKYRDLQCQAAGQQLEGGSIEPIVINKCLVSVTRHRIDEIHAAYEIGGRILQ